MPHTSNIVSHGVSIFKSPAKLSPCVLLHGVWTGLFCEMVTASKTIPFQKDVQLFVGYAKGDVCSPFGLLKVQRRNTWTTACHIGWLMCNKFMEWVRATLAALAQPQLQPENVWKTALCAELCT